MRDWVQYVRKNLALTELKKEREAKIVEDLVRQLEDFYREGLSRNMTETEADAYAREQIKDWDCLESDLRRACSSAACGPRRSLTPGSTRRTFLSVHST